jgi:predicted nucleic acid-binding protein
MIYLIDSNVLLDVLTEDPAWFGWSASRLAHCAEDGIMVINAIIYGEVSIGFDKIEDLEAALPPEVFRRDPIPWGAAFLAGKCFLQYRRRRGTRTTPLPDFFIGAHAAIADYTLVTRDARRYRTYFPKLAIISPEFRD